MKKFIVYAACFFITLFVVNFVYAEKETVSTKATSFMETIKNNEYVIKASDIARICCENIKSGWNGFKEWFSKLPGIKQYNESVYSGKNWKKTMNSMSDEYKPHLQPNAEGFKMLKQGKKKWDNL